MWPNDIDVFSIESWDSTFTALNKTWLETSTHAKSGLAKFVLGASLAVVSAQSIAFDRNLAMSEIRLHGPPVLTQLVTNSADLPAISTGGDDSDQALAEQYESLDGSYRPITLNSELKKLQGMQSALADIVSINPRAVRVARIISHQIQAPVTPSIGFDATGNVFLHFKDDRVDAYLTIERQALHLFCKVVGQRNIYIDNEPLLGKRLPSNIRDKLSEIFLT